MKKQGLLVILVLVASSTVAAAPAPAAGSASAPAAAPPSPSPDPSSRPPLGPGERQEAMRRIRALPPAEREEAMRRQRELWQAERKQDLPQTGNAKPVAVPRDNHTQVQVVSVDATAGTLTFQDVEGETNTWRFEPAGIARDPLLQPGSRVNIIWRSDKDGRPVPTILGVAAVSPSVPRPARQRPTGAQQPPMPGGKQVGPRGRPSPSPAASPKPASPPSS